MGKGGRPKGSKPVGKQVETVFKKGKSGNPSGTSAAIQKARMQLEQESLKFLTTKVEATDNNTGQKKKMSRHEIQLQLLYNKTINAKDTESLEALEKMWSWIKTRPSTKVELTGEGGGPITSTQLTGELTLEQATQLYRKHLKGE